MCLAHKKTSLERKVGANGQSTTWAIASRKKNGLSLILWIDQHSPFLQVLSINTGIYDDFTIPGNGMTKNDSSEWCFFRKWNLCGHGGATTALLKVEVVSEIRGFRINVHRQWVLVNWQTRPARTCVHASFVTWSTIHCIRTIGLCMFPSKWKGWGLSWFGTKNVVIVCMAVEYALALCTQVAPLIRVAGQFIFPFVSKARLKKALVFSDFD